MSPTVFQSACCWVSSSELVIIDPGQWTVTKIWIPEEQDQYHNQLTKLRLHKKTARRYAEYSDNNVRNPGGLFINMGHIQDINI
jgi:hypothetical protein